MEFNKIKGIDPQIKDAKETTQDGHVVLLQQKIQKEPCEFLLFETSKVNKLKQWNRFKNNL